MARRLWLLKISYAGTDWLWSTAPCCPLEGTTPRPHNGGLEIDDLEEDMALLGSTPELRSINVALKWPSPGVAALEAQGHDLTAAVGELSIWTEGTDYATREIHIAEAKPPRPEYGGLDEKVTMNLEEQPYTDTTQIPDSRSVVDADTWPLAHASNIGRVYPQVCGLPGHVTGRTAISRDIPGSVAPLVRPATNIILLAGHGVRATTVTVWDSAGTAFLAVPVVEMADGLGRTCATANLTGPPAGFLLGEATYGVAWPSAGGRPGPDGGEIQGAGQLLLWALGSTDIRIDWHRLRTIAPMFDWLIGTAYNEEITNGWTWVQDHLLGEQGLLPASIVPAGDGIDLIPWRFDALASDAVDQLEEGPGIVRLTKLERDGRKVINSCTVRFAYNTVTGNCENQVTVCGYPDPDDPTQHGCKEARISQDRLTTKSPAGAVLDTGIRAETIESQVIYSERAAVQVALWRVVALSKSRQTVSYRIPVRNRRRGDVVTLTSADLCLTNAVCLVQGRTVSDRGTMALTLMVL